VLVTINLHEGFIDEERVAVASMPAFQSSGVQSAKFDTPEAD
jgi:hypothetical protein